MEEIKLNRGVLLDSRNIAKDILGLDNGQARLDEIGALVSSEYDEDKSSRAQWEESMAEANRLALQITEAKNFPWPNAANVAFPLVTVAALQFFSRVSPAFMSGKHLVRCAVTGKDPDGAKRARADRIATHMTHQLRRENEAWEEDHDRMLFALPIVGTTFKKTYYDGTQNVSEYVLPDHLVVSYRAKFDRAERKTHRLFYTPRQVRERQLKGLYLDIDLAEPAYQPDMQQTEQDRREGTVPRQESLHELLEQHRFLDLDGDGYEEPYVVTVNRQDRKVVRIVARFDEEGIETDRDDEIRAIVRQVARDTSRLRGSPLGAARAAANAKAAQQSVADIKRTAKILRIEPQEYFTRYEFIPNPYSGVYAIGLGALLGPINKTINTALNQLLDAGTLANAGGGWFGRGAKRKGKVRVAPGVWQQTSIPGKDLAQNIVPYPVREPSAVLFNLISLLINYGERVASVTDMMVGETPGQNTPATTAMASLEQGMKVFQGIFRRVFRAATKEYRKLYLLNRDHLDFERYVTLLDDDARLLQADYEGDVKDIEPVADESMITDAQRTQRAAFLAERARTVPGYDTAAVELRILEAAGIDDAREVFPVKDGKPVIAPPPDKEMELKIAEQERRTQEAQDRARNNAGKLELEAAELAIRVAEARVNMKLTAEKARREGIEADLEPLRVSIDAFTARYNAIQSRLKAVQESSNAGSRAVAGPPGNGNILPLDTGTPGPVLREQGGG